jgi:hypothetical protein
VRYVVRIRRPDQSCVVHQIDSLTKEAWYTRLVTLNAADRSTQDARPTGNRRLSEKQSCDLTYGHTGW